MSSADIHRHREAGTCFICEEPALPEQGLHGATGAHWDCAQQLQRDVEEAAPKGELLLAHKACGSVRAHWVDTATGVALCGDAPKNTSKTMKPRGKWLQLRNQDPAGHRDVCQKCSAMHTGLNKEKGVDQ